MAVCTCSRPISSRTDERVTRATSATAVAANAMAGSVRWSIVPITPLPVPSAGNQPRLTENTRIRSTAATNEGIAADRVEIPITPMSIAPGRSAPISPSPTPVMMMISDA